MAIGEKCVVPSNTTICSAGDISCLNGVCIPALSYNCVLQPEYKVYAEANQGVCTSICNGGYKAINATVSSCQIRQAGKCSNTCNLKCVSVGGAQKPFANCYECLSNNGMIIAYLRL